MIRVINRDFSKLRKVGVSEPGDLLSFVVTVVFNFDLDEVYGLLSDGFSKKDKVKVYPSIQIVAAGIQDI